MSLFNLARYTFYGARLDEKSEVGKLFCGTTGVLYILRLREMWEYKSLLTRKVLFDMTYVSQS